MEGEVAAVRH